MGSGTLPGLRSQVTSITRSHIRAIAELGAAMEDVVPLWFGEGDTPTPEFIRAATAESLARGETFYTPNRGIGPLRQAIADYLTGLHARPVALNRVTATLSGMNAIMLAMQTIVDPGDRVVIVAPVWPNVREAVRVLGGEPVEVPLARDPDSGRFSMDLDRVLDACDARTKAIFVNSPGNPTGWVMPDSQVAALLDAARARGIWVLSDEVYSRLVYDGSAHAPSFLDHAAPDDPLIVINSFSKAWSMTGWRLGWLITPPGLGDLLGKLTEFNVSCATTFVQHGGIAALRGGEGYVAGLVARYGRARRTIVEGLLSMRRVRVAEPEGAFYAFFSVDGESDSVALAYRLLHEARVGLAPGLAFGNGGEAHLRLCFAASDTLLNRALDRLRPVLDA
ncbi:pyridoxal phosphate-dependent aminotransferase [Marinibaculum pumilum]|uniref:Aminotransferase n=1 Tax=Marinibaculum pumilum TaxID=1766165 RepID=A0ABV7L796_9PROT